MLKGVYLQDGAVSFHKWHKGSALRRRYFTGAVALGLLAPLRIDCRYEGYVWPEWQCNEPLKTNQLITITWKVCCG